MEIQPRPTTTHPATHNAQEHAFDFQANDKDFWLLEMKNIILTVVTLGIYSAWATVNRRKYLAQHTFLEGANFDYVADPKVILRSRLIMVAVFVAICATQAVSESAFAVCMGLYMLCLPWAIVSSLAFHAKNTTYRGARFSFNATTAEGYIWYLKVFALHFGTLGLGLPLVQRLVSKFLAEHYHLGGKAFRFEGETGPYFKLSLRCAGILLGTMLVLGLAGFGMSMLALKGVDAGDAGPSGTNTILAMAGSAAVLFVYFFGYIAFSVVICGIVARSINLIASHVRFGDHSFSASQTGKGLFLLWLVNYLLVVFTCGLAYPIVVLRMRNYRYANLKVQARGPLMEGVQLDLQGGGRGGSDAAGAALMDLGGGMDFGI